jgi:TonB family protein
MALTTKNSPELNGPGKSGQSPRSNPVCLEVSVIIRSLPSEVGGSTQPFREECRTVIVFDNGAVIRSTSNLSVGQSVIVSNSKGREVVCRVAGGRNLPSVKGYVEVEFIEAVNDFWGIHQDTSPGAVAAPQAAPPLAAPPAPREIAAAPTAAIPVTPRAIPPVEVPARPASLSLGSGPSAENVAARVGMPGSAASRDSKNEPTRLGQDKVSKNASDYSSSQSAKPTSLANWDPPASDPPVEKLAVPAKREAPSIAPAAPAPTRDFLSKGLMAYEQPHSTSGTLSGRVPLIVGVTALVLAGVCGVVFFIHRNTAPISIVKTAAVSQPTAAQPPAAKAIPQPAPAPPEEAAPVATETQMQSQPVAADAAQPVAAVGPLPTVVASPAVVDSPVETRPDTRNVRRSEKKAVAAKQPELPSARRPLIPNLKIGSPIAPNQTPANQGEGSAPITDVAAGGGGGAVPSAGLLTSNGRTSNPPAPPPPAFASAAPVISTPATAAPAPVAAAKTVRDPKLISSVRPAYPAAAKSSSIQGTVAVSASIDANGKVVAATALSGPMLLRQAAADAVKQWKYSPGLIDGKPAPSQVTVNVDFRIN